MAEISVKNIVKAFEEDKNILDGLTFEVHRGERVGLIGKNGAGKTTLFRIISGEVRPDEGEIAIAGGDRVGIIDQIPHFPADFTGEDVLKTAQKRQYELKKQIEATALQMENDPTEELLRRYDALTDEFTRLDGYDLDRLRDTVANGLKIPQSQREQLFDSLSGGEKTRLNLARLILEDTDILLLDEPTNHLDMSASEWLEEYLLKYKGTVLIISHDRYFLDRVITRTVEIVNGKAEFYSGNYSYYLEEKQRRYEEQLKKYQKEQAEIKRLSEAADRLYQWGTGNKKLMQKSFAIQSRIERMEKTERPTAEKAIKAKFSERSFRGDQVIKAKGLTKRFGEKTLFEDVEVEVGAGERIAVIGDNGSGKSTFIKLLMGEEKPDAGFIASGPSIKKAYLPQIIRFAHPERSILDTLIYDEKCSPQTARNRLGAFKFSGEDVFRPVGQLSGGEQSRLRLCVLMKDDINLLILDEPTNHLDIASREWIEDAVSEYGETLLFVSHDRYFINKFANRIWEINGGRFTDFRGDFEAFKKYKASLAVEKTEEKPQKVKEKPKEKKVRTKNTANQVAKLEREIAALENKIKETEAEKEKFATDYSKLMELDAETDKMNGELEEKLSLWEELSALL